MSADRGEGEHVEEQTDRNEGWRAGTEQSRQGTGETNPSISNGICRTRWGGRTGGRGSGCRASMPMHRRSTGVRIRWHLAHTEWQPGQHANGVSKRAAQQATRQARKVPHTDRRADGRTGERTRGSEDMGVRWAGRQADGQEGWRAGASGQSHTVYRYRPYQMASRE